MERDIGELNMDEKDIIIMAYEKNPYGIGDERRTVFAEGFLTAANLLQGLAWHKTSKGLPKDKRFFACHDFPNIEVLEYSDKKNGYWNMKGSFFAEPGSSQYFTHWMPIPELSKED